MTERLDMSPEEIAAAARGVADSAAQSMQWNYDQMQIAALNAVEDAFRAFASAIEAGGSS